ncbi:hypothetical protein PYCCODRAFT_551752 [Trametes coccinea BRFM310]|uniref:Uncharacterized protein n=1 Tax=Trametes coccinea (strain BRFM310) TaxID=1353009 RepID=A0A1Y2IJ87_TRAC3|nr:hypothetical protein PYCCODRAFT_551752 [Trametes coccinea BRFM310]
MQFKVAILLGLAAVAVQGAPEKRDNGVTLPNGSTFAFPTGTISADAAASYVDANSAAFLSLLGTATFEKLEASIAIAQAEEGIGAATTELTAFATTINSTPVVKVSSIGGNQEITIATGTAGVTTIFGGKAFTAVPNGADQLASVPRGLWAGAGAVLGSLLLGAAIIF